MRYVADQCEILCENNNKVIVADILNFQNKSFLSVSLNKSVRLNLYWNGHVFEGTMGNLSFTSNGPAITETRSRV